MPHEAICPFCGQPLLDKAALRRVHESEHALEKKIRDQAAAKAAELAKPLVAKAEKEHAEKIKGLQQQLKDEQDQISALKRVHTTELRKAKTAARAEAKHDAVREAESKVKGELRKYQRTVERLREENEEQARRIENLTAEERGEFSEEELVLKLKAAFPDDHIERVRRGQSGADILQEVMVRGDAGFAKAGLIVYECKDTLNWNNDFVVQAKRAGQTHRTPYLVVVSRAFPRNEKALCVRDGVVIVHPTRMVDLAKILRRMVEEVNRASLTAEDEVAKSEELYGYLTSPEFRQTFDAIGEDVNTLHDLLQKEQKWHDNTWAKRNRIYEGLTRRTSSVDARIRAIIERPLDAELSRVVRLRAKGKRKAAR